MAESITYDSKREGPPDLRLIHFNDVYHVEPGSREPVGGIARFQTVCNYYRNDARFKDRPKLLTFFSGDAFNPSLESRSHMVPVLNQIGTDVACVGNHDLDFGVKQFRHLSSKCTFPWLLANVLDPALGPNTPLGNAQPTHMLTSSSGIKIGIIGLVEREWLDTINSLPPNLIYKSASQTAKELVPGLRAAGAEIVIALSHQREPNDNKLANNTPEGLIDIVLGGHDHFYQHSVLNGTHVLRSGSDFKQLSYLECWRSATKPGIWDFRIIRRDIERSIPEDAAAVALTSTLASKLASKLDKPIGVTAAPLDARFTTVRLKESNYGNFVCDMMRMYYAADCAMMAAGTIRGDQIYPPGVLKMKDIMDCFPFEDPVVVLRVKGDAVRKALENGVSQYPALEGRFLQVSGIGFGFDPKKIVGERVADVEVGGKPLDEEREYVVVTRDYMARGKDGFTSLRTKEAGGVAESVVSEEEGILISMMLRQYFLGLKTIGRWKQWSKSIGRHWDRVQRELHDVHPVQESKGTNDGKGSNVGMDSNDSDSDDEPTPTDGGFDVTEKQKQIIRYYAKKWWKAAGLKGHADLVECERDMAVGWTKGIEPRVEGRITLIEA
ncbi:MAG: hypothetical protein MMC23_005571 [Stictis urceolatum]|nr:hypothetical protein [Stictis urceolata]